MQSLYPYLENQRWRGKAPVIKAVEFTLIGNQKVWVFLELEGQGCDFSLEKQLQQLCFDSERRCTNCELMPNGVGNCPED